MEVIIVLVLLWGLIKCCEGLVDLSHDDDPVCNWIEPDKKNNKNCK